MISEKYGGSQTNIIGQDAILFEHISKTGKGFYITVSFSLPSSSGESMPM